MLNILLSAVFGAVPVLGAAAEAQPAAPEKGAEAARPAKPAGSQWFKNLLMGLQKSAVESRYRRVRSSAVASVRGAGQEEADPQKPYWKGGLSERQALQTRKEREEFAGAVDAILAGRYDEGGAKLDEFGKAHPASKYLNDVKDARAKLEELRAHGAVAEEPAPAPEPE
ncbi:MAG TPA: hypothetical protein DCM05_12680 [Elusimicrobia bacterium]|nr:hypothetical protein [Elusimicrobiota bacterium]